ncbi:MAG TPA: SycD/LcrH family type III secretion system chaperone [Parachlamydiaceae bacterium]|nr:SycD/LcrH family type III secretion system chaperone [Parachlamydiaceae bacterium]
MKGEQQQINKAAELTGTTLKDANVDNIKASIQRATKKGTSPKDALGLTDAMIEGVYGQAYRLYNTGKYKEAIQIFRLLIMINSTEPKYAMGLAACFHMLKEYQTAVDTYTIVGVIDPESPISFYHASDCFMQMGDQVSAMIALEMAVKRAGDKPEFRTLKDRASLTVDSIKKELAKTQTNTSDTKQNTSDTKH